MSRLRTTPRSPAAKLGAFGVVLAVAFGGGVAVGAALGPDGSADEQLPHDDDSSHDLDRHGG